MLMIINNSYEGNNHDFYLGIYLLNIHIIISR